MKLIKVLQIADKRKPESAGVTLTTLQIPSGQLNVYEHQKQNGRLFISQLRLQIKILSFGASS